MGFENPLWLWGALAAAIPLVLHLIMRRRAQLHAFAAVEFILLSNKKVARRLRLKQWLLMMMRMLLVAAIPLAFAKPYLTTDQKVLSVPGAQAPASIVLVIDASFSMGYRVGSTTLVERAVARAADIIDDLSPESDAAIVLATSPARALTQRLTYDRLLLRDALDAVEPTWSRADLQGALRIAEQILVASSQPRRQVVLLTDLQASEWQGMQRPWALERSPGVTVLDVRAGPTDNVAITAVTAEPEAGGMGREVRVSVEVLNDRPQAFEDVVTVRVGGKTAKGIVKAAPRERATKEFTIRLAEAGSIAGHVELPPDQLAGDNRHPFVIDFFERVRVLVVNGAPRSVPHRDETFFLRAALRPSGDSGSRMSPTFVKPEELTPAQLTWVDVVVLANVTRLDAGRVESLREWVSRGGGLLISGGENVTREVYNGVMAPLMPLPVRDIKDAGERPLFLTGVDTSHPAMALFAAMPDASLFTAAVRRYVLLDTAASDARVLASYTDGAPAFVESRVGAGRIAMLTTTLDRDWCDLPFETSYLPLIQHTLLHLAGRLERIEQSSLVVGDARAIGVGRDVEEIRVTRPDGRRTDFSGSDLAVGDVRYHDTALSGIYTVRQVRGQGADEERFAVHVDERESQLEPIDLATVDQLLEAGSAPTPAGAGTRTPPPERRGNLWPILLLSLFVLLGLETWLAWQSG